MCGILILADNRPKLGGISFHAVVVFDLGKNLLFKSILGRCESEAVDLRSLVEPNPKHSRAH